MAEAQSHTRSRLLDLPFEIRSKIFRLVLDESPIQVHPGHRADQSTHLLPRRELNQPSGPSYNRSLAHIDAASAGLQPLTLVNRQVRAETAPILTRGSNNSSSRVFNFPSTRALLDVVTHLPPAQQARIKRARVRDHRALAYTSYATARGETHVVAPTVFTLPDALALAEDLRLADLLIESTFNLASAPRHAHWGERLLTQTLFEAANMAARVELVSRCALRLRYVQPLARRFAGWRASAYAPTANRRVRVLVRPAELAAPTCFSAALDRHVSPVALAAVLREEGTDMDWLQPLTRKAAREVQARHGLAYVPRAVVVVENGEGFSRDGLGEEVPPKSLPVPAEWSWPQARASEFTIVHDCMDFEHAYRNFLALRAAREGDESDASVEEGDWGEDEDEEV